MAGTITKSLLGAEDINKKDSGTSLATYTRVDSTGRTHTISKLDGAHIQFRTLAKSLDDLVDGGFDVELKVSKISGGATNTNGHTVPDVADDTFALLAATQTLTNKTLTTPDINGGTVDAITSLTVANNVDIGAFSLTALSLVADTISEEAAGAGVTIDSFKIKDNAPDPTSWPSFFAHRNGSQQVNITGIDKIEFNDDSTDPGFDTNSDYNTGTFRWIPTVAGKYFLTTSIYWINVVAGDTIILYLYKNGVVITLDTSGIVNTPQTQTITSIVTANGSTDYFEVFAQNSDRDTGDIEGQKYNTWFIGSRIA